MNKFTIFSALLCTVSALTIPLALRDVAVPPVTEPTENTVWVVGTTQSVKWDISDLPPRENISNPLGKVVLGFLTDDSYNLNIDSPLAEGFDILDGKVDITVPQVEPKDNYIVAVFGNSGNISPMFKIMPAGSAALVQSTIDPNDSQWNSPPLTGSVITGGESSTRTTTTFVDPSSGVPGGESSSRTTTTFVDPSSGVPGGSTIVETSAPEPTATEPTQATDGPSSSSEPGPDASEPVDSEPEPTGASLPLRGRFSACFAPVLGAVVLLLI